MAGPVISLTEADREALWAHLLDSGRGTEEVAFLFAQYDGANGGAFRVVEWYAVPPEGFAFCSAWHFELSDETRAYVIKRAHDLDASLIEAHSHDEPDPPAFSPSDLYGFTEFVPHVWWRLKRRPYSALVVSPGGLDGFVWRQRPDVPERLVAVEAEGRILRASHRSVLRWTNDMERYSDG